MVEARTISLRPASAADCPLIFQWRNNPLIVGVGSLRATVSREEHEKWFTDSLAMPARRMLYVIEGDNTPMGLVRFDRDDGERTATISVYVVPPNLGKGFGVAAIDAGCREIAARWGISEIVACVREDNGRGIRAFEKCGFIAWPHARCPAQHKEFRRHVA